jgi:hypothetical protein
MMMDMFVQAAISGTWSFGRLYRPEIDLEACYVALFHLPAAPSTDSESLAITIIVSAMPFFFFFLNYRSIYRDARHLQSKMTPKK